METLDIEPIAHESAKPSVGGNGAQAAPDSQRARNVVQSQAILGSPALNAPKASTAPRPQALAQAKKTRGKLARNILQETDVSGRDEAGKDRASSRGDSLAAAISMGGFQPAADALAGPSFDSQKSFQKAFVAAWKTFHKSYDDKGAEGAALLDPILTAKFRGNKLGYLQDLREHGESSSEWAVLLVLGEIEGGVAHDDAVVRAFERAAEKLDNAKFKVFWAKVEAPLKKNMHHVLTSDRRLRRVLALKDLKLAEGPVEAAEGKLKQAEDDEHAADTKKDKTEANLEDERGRRDREKEAGDGSRREASHRQARRARRGEERQARGSSRRRPPRRRGQVGIEMSPARKASSRSPPWRSRRRTGRTQRRCRRARKRCGTSSIARSARARRG